MPAITFPASPYVNQIYTVGSKSWQWDGTVWNAYYNESVDSVYGTGADGDAVLDGTNNNSAFRRGNIISDTGMDTVTIVFLDSPATTSATTYKMQYGTRVGTLYVNRRGSDTNFVTSSTITAQEIAG